MSDLLTGKRNLCLIMMGLLLFSVRGEAAYAPKSMAISAKVVQSAVIPPSASPPAPLIYSGQESGASYGHSFDSPFTTEEKTELKKYAAKDKLSSQELCRVNEILGHAEDWNYDHRYFFFLEELLRRDTHYRNTVVYEQDGWIYDPILQVSYSPFAQILLRYTNDCCGIANQLSGGNDFFLLQGEDMHLSPLETAQEALEKKKA